MFAILAVISCLLNVVTARYIVRLKKKVEQPNIGIAVTSLHVASPRFTKEDVGAVIKVNGQSARVATVVSPTHVVLHRTIGVVFPFSAPATAALEATLVPQQGREDD